MYARSNVVETLAGVSLLPRSFCYARCWHRFDDDSHVIVFAPAEHPCAPDEGLLSTRADFSGAVLISSVSEYSGCVITYLNTTDIKTAFLKDRINKAVQRNIVLTLAGVRESVSCSL